MLFDSHAHYDDSRFDADRDEILRALPDRGVGRVVTCGCTAQQSVKLRKLAGRHSHLYFAAGVHPLDCGEVELAGQLELIEELQTDKKCVAIGEIGLDYYYKKDNKDTQILFFEEQIKLALKLEKPVIVHDREAHGDCFALLDKYRPRGVMHCFSGSAELAREYVKRGFYISFAGVITFPNAKKAAEAAAFVPMDRLLIETDCPYLAPVPFRGKRNDSSYLGHTCGKLAEIKGVSRGEMEARTYENACELFGIKA